jgi:hypothetical protein
MCHASTKPSTAARCWMGMERKGCWRMSASLPTPFSFREWSHALRVVQILPVGP